MEFFRTNRVVIARSMGIFMLLISFIIYFWDIEQKTLTPNERAAANIARMEAKVSVKTTTNKHESSKFLQHLQKKQDEQLRYMLIFFMIFGLGFLGYSFIKRD